MNAAEKNSPDSQLIGAIQANSSTTKHFLFATDMSVCEFFEDQLRCVESEQRIGGMVKSQQVRLPLTKGFHQLHVKEGRLTSKLLSSAAVKLHLHLKDYEVSTHRQLVCPQIEEPDFVFNGCFRYIILAEVTLEARSSCRPGLASVSFETLQPTGPLKPDAGDPKPDIVEEVPTAQFQNPSSTCICGAASQIHCPADDAGDPKPDIVEEVPTAQFQNPSSTCISGAASQIHCPADDAGDQYLSTGMSFRALAFSFRMGNNTVGAIIKEVIIAIWEELQPLHMQVPTTEKLKKVAADFPHVVGCLDGKHKFLFSNHFV
ncbi:hypothetical protein JTE90_026930 [Oedothorax gibbosus]|uniref:Vitellogenin n=1 Tax=Oedothorax gibbosus TaxID=931172 RepID=A0AAV6TWA4_9ARAC|nr:hypothetical protein JTE90_026930 [Oedothorax gibbosus]